VGWYDQFSQLVAARDEQAEERGHIGLMIALDNWRWMPVRQACRLVGRQRRDAMEDAKLMAQMQFGKRLVLLNTINSPEVIPPEMGNEVHEEPGARGGPLRTQEMLDQEGKKDVLQLERQVSGFCRNGEISRHQAENRRKADVWGSSLQEQRQSACSDQVHPGWRNSHADLFLGQSAWS
jgi:hypothetical protein